MTVEQVQAQAQAAVNEIARQRDSAQERCIHLAQENTVLRLRLEQAEKPEKPDPEPDPE